MRCDERVSSCRATRRSGTRCHRLHGLAANEAPSSLDELARITGRAKSNLSRTLKTMAGYGLVQLERGDKGRITPKITHDRVELDLPLIGSRDTDQSRKVG
jgi:predicted transcriptional regulator